MGVQKAIVFVLCLMTTSVATFAQAYQIDKDLKIDRNATESFTANPFYQSKYGRKMNSTETAEFLLIKAAVELSYLGLSLDVADCRFSPTDFICREYLKTSGGNVSAQWNDEISFKAFTGIRANTKDVTCQLSMSAEGRLDSRGRAILLVEALSIVDQRGLNPQECEVLNDYFADQVVDGKMTLRFKNIR